MTQVTNSDLMNVLLTIQKDIGETKATITNTAERLTQHIEADDKLNVRLYGDASNVGDITRIQLGIAKQKGFLSALTGVGSILGAGIGYLVERALRGH